MAEDGRPAKRGHCLGLLPRALWLMLTRVVLRPDRWRHGDPYPPEAADSVGAHADTVPVERAVPWTGDRRIPWRASDEWLTGAVEGYDWTAAERDVRKRVR